MWRVNSPFDDLFIVIVIVKALDVNVTHFSRVIGRFSFTHMTGLAMYSANSTLTNSTHSCTVLDQLCEK